MISRQQAKYFAYELTRINKDNDIGGVARGLMDAQVDLNPHQVEAAVFAVRSPLSKGVILADEVGLGKTIEAGIVICQLWAEQKRHLLVICPASLREQWKSELEDKFNLPAIIIDSSNYYSGILDLTDKIIISSYNFAVKIEQDLQPVPWNLVIMDEAHKLRNVYRPSNKAGRILKSALNGRRKLLLTATPLQNSLMELYGLSSLIDDGIFGDDQSFRAQYTTATKSGKDALKERLACFCKRTLRSQVTEYVSYTKRIPITFPFCPSETEQTLYSGVAHFLQKDSKYALPPKQRQLTSLILYKLLASSSSAILGTFETMLTRLEKLKAGLISENDDLDDLIDDVEIADEIEDLEEDSTDETEKIDKAALEKEIVEVKKFIELAKKISVDNKTQELMKGLAIGFDNMNKMGAAKKALIFTESRRTQKYLFDYLSAHGYAGKIVLFHGGNKAHRKELIETFKNDAEIMIATEAGAEGLNMQFCSLIINYDLPWNPQRVEQRIGRCHRYGQKHDVVVINFVNKKNVADQRVFDLLNEKFQLFEGVFGASDEVLGSIEDGVDFEKKILNIYRTCRSTEEIEEAFKLLRKEMEDSIDEKMQQTKKLLLSEFDAVVHDRLKVNLELTKQILTERQKMFWNIARAVLKDDGVFDEQDFSFTLTNPELGKPQKYYFITQDNKHIDMDDKLIIRMSHPLGEKVLNLAKDVTLDTEEVSFDLTNNPQKETVLQNLKDSGAKGWCNCQFVTIDSFEREEYLVLSGMDMSGKSISPEIMARMLRLETSMTEKCNNISKDLNEDFENIQNKNLQDIKIRSESRNMVFYNEEISKIDKYTEDKLYRVEKELKDVKDRIKTLMREERQAETIAAKTAIQEEIAELERKKRRYRQNIFDAEDEIEEERKALIAKLKNGMKSTMNVKDLFTFKWKLV